jgi:hypothetical protein
MKFKNFLLGLIAAVVVAVPAVGLAHSANARVTVLHGIRGQDLGLPAELPVDIFVNGELALEDVAFGQHATVELPAGNYNIDVNLANTTTTVIDQDVRFRRGERATVIAHLTAAGAPTASKFTARIPAKLGYLAQFGHTAWAPAVDGYFRFRSSFFPLIRGLQNGHSTIASVNPSGTTVAITPAGTLNPVLGPVDITSLLNRRQAYQFFVVGSANGAAGNTLTVLRVAI